MIALAGALLVTATARAAAPRAEVIHWWTSGGESAAVKQIAQAYRAAGGVWIDTAIAGGDQARAVTISRMVGGNAPTAAQFNTSMQFSDLVEQGMLNNVDDIARKQDWDRTLPAALVNVIKIKGHYYAVPLNVHMQTWIWYSKAAFRQAGISAEPQTMDQLFAALDKLKAAGLVPLAHGGQGWQETLLFSMVLADLGGRDLYLAVLRERDQRAIASDAFKKVLLAFKRLRGYTDAGAPGRNWNDATSLLIRGKAGVQVMGDWAKGEFSAAQQVADQQYGCLPGLGPKAPYLIQGDVFVFPKSADANVLKAQKLLADVIVAPATQLAFSKLKGSIPMRGDVDASQLDACAQKGLAAMKDRSRQLGVTEVYLTPDQNGAMQDVLTAFWNTGMTVDKAQKSFAAALKN
jgi:glucose/mannose transport system substrate-binding protein